VEVNNRRVYVAADAVLLRERILELRGDERIDAWEEAFLASLSKMLNAWGTETRLSEKQVAKLEQIVAKVMAPPVAESESEDGAE
jgi:hypothetical protein